MESKRVSEYELVCKLDSAQLTELVNEELKAGWQPLGAPFKDVVNTYIYQAMVKLEEPSDRTQAVMTRLGKLVMLANRVLDAQDSLEWKDSANKLAKAVLKEAGYEH